MDLFFKRKVVLEMDEYENLKLNNQFCFSLYSLAKEITRLYKPFLDELGITYTQYITLLVLWEKDGINMNEIGDRVCLDSGTLTPLLKKLESNGFIERKRPKEDERNIIVTLTDKGKELKEKAVDIPKLMAEKTNIPIEEIVEERDRLKGLYKKIKR